MSLLHIVKASAGSGKTFRLTLEYLSHLYDETDNFRHILAVTFTNKATEEMKSRIINVLYQLASGIQNNYLKPLSALTGRNEKEIRMKSDIILKKLLHNYTRFSVSTIDSFFQSVIRSFTREIGIQGGYRIELDNDLVLQKATDNLFGLVDHDKTLLKWLTEFSENRIEETKGWDLKRDLLRLGSEIFKERYRQFSNETARKLHDKELLISYRKELSHITRKVEKELSDYGNQGITVIEQNGFQTDDFFQKSKGPAGYLYKLADTEIIPPNSFVMKTYDNLESWSKRDHPRWHQIIKVCEESLQKILHKAVDFYLENSNAYFTAKTLLKNFYTLGIINDITKSVYNYTRDHNLFMISDSARFINRIIDNNDAPFIYEKTGNHFHHFLVDEFQDTSDFQWKNFKPLISNSLSQNFSCLVVGDVKQSIYRWRNSNWEILSDGIENDFYKGAVKTESLGINWRSEGNIVSFNNSFFSIAPGILQLQHNLESGSNGNEIRGLYTDTLQNLPDQSHGEGYVSISFTEKTIDFEEKVCKLTTDTIKKLLETGFMPGNIAILTRGKKEGRVIADYLLEFRQRQSAGSIYRFNVISDESLFLGSSSVIRFIIAVLRYLAEPENHINNYLLLFDYINCIAPSDIGSTAKVPEYYADLHETCMLKILPEDFKLIHDLTANRSLYEKLQVIIRMFSLNSITGEQAYLMAFKDMITDYVEYNGSGIPAFLNYWEETGKQKSIQGNEEQDAVRIMTIHKSKGLEFEAVIIPYCNWKMDRSDDIIWCRPTEKPFDMLDIVPVDYGSSLKNTLFAHDFYEEKQKTYLDNLNLLYVAFTRARNALFVINQDSDVKQDMTLNNISQLISVIFNDEKILKTGFEKSVNNNLKIFEKGSLKKPESENASAPANYLIGNQPENSTIGRMGVSYHASEYLEHDDSRLHPMNYGKIMHELFSLIISEKDVDPAVEFLYLQGKLNENEKVFIRNDIRSLLNDIQVKSWFSGDYKVLNERDILCRSHENRRPDRVLIKDNSAVIIDYKFGQKELNEHRRQVLDYADLLTRMGYIQVEIYLWYINKRKIIQVRSEDNEIPVGT